MAAHRRHDISDRTWANIEKLLPGSKGSVGRPSADNQDSVNFLAYLRLKSGARRRRAPYKKVAPRCRGAGCVRAFWL